MSLPVRPSLAWQSCFIHKRFQPQPLGVVRYFKHTSWPRHKMLTVLSKITYVDETSSVWRKITRKPEGQGHGDTIRPCEALPRRRDRSTVMQRAQTPDSGRLRGECPGGFHHSQTMRKPDWRIFSVDVRHRASPPNSLLTGNNNQSSSLRGSFGTLFFMARGRNADGLSGLSGLGPNRRPASRAGGWRCARTRRPPALRYRGSRARPQPRR